MVSKEPNQVLGPMFAALSKDGSRVLADLDLAADAKILDVGTGGGNFAIFLALQGFQVLTGEPEADGSRYARQDWAAKAQAVGVLEQIRFQPFTAEALPFETGSFDAVFFFGVLHHVEEAQRGAVLQEALRVANSDGAVVVFEPTEDTLETLWASDPDHPPAALPSRYLANPKIREERLKGSLMNAFIYRQVA
ncbi:MAG: hypothetical protein Kilf2KO_17050 [Rhodospirillales bacterium]